MKFKIILLFSKKILKGFIHKFMTNLKNSKQFAAAEEFTAAEKFV